MRGVTGGSVPWLAELVMREKGFPCSSLFIHSWPVLSQNCLNWPDQFPIALQQVPASVDADF